MNSKPLPSEHAATYTIIGILFAGLLVITNVVAVKLIDVGPFTVDGGVVLFPLVYVLGDVLAEVYGFRATRRIIFSGFALSIIASLTIFLVQLAPPAVEWEGQESFEEVLGFVPRIVTASLCGYLVGQLLNAWLIVWLKKRAFERHEAGQKPRWWAQLWVRLVSSTMLGQAADTVVFCFIAFFGTLVGWRFAGYVLLGYGIKILAEVLLLPITTRVIARVKKHEPQHTSTV